MFNKSSWLLASAFCVFLAASAAAQSPWLGIYEFTENGGKNAGGTAIMVTHHLEILKSDDGLVATLESNGYQTSKDLLCLVKIQGNKAMLYFEGYGDNNMFESYNKGQLMLTLEERAEDGKSTLLTYWNAFKPIIPKNEKSGKAYFTKI
ncbi:MAG: hypothetical protein DMF62_09130 [Acidobacteria bacterium]|nr:MAG: hypothetical protein DMF62_09130 [Acidobacteriota bacterium]